MSVASVAPSAPSNAVSPAAAPSFRPAGSPNNRLVTSPAPIAPPAAATQSHSHPNSPLVHSKLPSNFAASSPIEHATSVHSYSPRHAMSYSSPHFASPGSSTSGPSSLPSVSTFCTAESECGTSIVKSEPRLNLGGGGGVSYDNQQQQQGGEEKGGCSASQPPAGRGTKRKSSATPDPTIPNKSPAQSSPSNGGGSPAGSSLYPSNMRGASPQVSTATGPQALEPAAPPVRTMQARVFSTSMLHRAEKSVTMKSFDSILAFHSAEAASCRYLPPSEDDKTKEQNKAQNSSFGKNTAIANMKALTDSIPTPCSWSGASSSSNHDTHSAVLTNNSSHSRNHNSENLSPDFLSKRAVKTEFLQSLKKSLLGSDDDQGSQGNTAMASAAPNGGGGGGMSNPPSSMHPAMMGVSSSGTAAGSSVMQYKAQPPPGSQPPSQSPTAGSGAAAGGGGPHSAAQQAAAAAQAAANYAMMKQHHHHQQQQQQEMHMRMQHEMMQQQHNHANCMQGMCVHQAPGGGGGPMSLPGGGGVPSRGPPGGGGPPVHFMNHPHSAMAAAAAAAHAQRMQQMKCRAGCTGNCTHGPLPRGIAGGRAPAPVQMMTGPHGEQMMHQMMNSSGPNMSAPPPDMMMGAAGNTSAGPYPMMHPGSRSAMPPSSASPSLMSRGGIGPGGGGGGQMNNIGPPINSMMPGPQNPTGGGQPGSSPQMMMPSNNPGGMIANSGSYPTSSYQSAPNNSMINVVMTIGGMQQQQSMPQGYNMAGGPPPPQSNIPLDPNAAPGMMSVQNMQHYQGNPRYPMNNPSGPFDNFRESDFFKPDDSFGADFGAAGGGGSGYGNGNMLGDSGSTAAGGQGFGDFAGDINLEAINPSLGGGSSSAGTDASSNQRMLSVNVEPNKFVVQSNMNGVQFNVQGSAVPQGPSMRTNAAVNMQVQQSAPHSSSQHSQLNYSKYQPMSSAAHQWNQPPQYSGGGGGGPSSHKSGGYEMYSNLSDFKPISDTPKGTVEYLPDGKTRDKAKEPEYAGNPMEMIHAAGIHPAAAANHDPSAMQPPPPHPGSLGYDPGNSFDFFPAM